jgi:uncharacterized membrane protein
MPAIEEFQQLQAAVAGLTKRVQRLEERLAKSGSSSLLTLDSHHESARVSAPPDWKPGGLETEIGAHWFNRIGIVAVFVSVGFFLNYAFDNEWVGPAGRVLIGLVLGVSTVFLSEFIRRRGHRIFSYSLKGIGIGVLYLSLWAASQVYHLIPNALAWFSMMTVTVATIGLALWQDAELIAAFAAFGAFLTPAMLSVAINNASSLFSYLAILNVGALVLLVCKPWIRVLLGSYAGTLILYSSWHYRFYTPDEFLLALTSVTAFFLIFAVAPFVYRQQGISLAVLLVALMNAASYFFELWRLFGYQSGELALTSIFLGCLYFVAGSRLRNSATPDLAEIHSAIGAAFLIVAVPIGFHARWITAGWFAEGAALVRLSPPSSRTSYLKQLGLLALVLGIIRLLAIDQFNVTRMLLNDRMLIFCIALASLSIASRKFSSSHNQADQRLLLVAVIFINFLALFALTQEITDAWRRQLLVCDAQKCGALSIIRDFRYSALWITYGAALLLTGFWRKAISLRWQALVLIGFTVGKVFVYDTSSLDRIYRVLSFMILGFVLLMSSFFYQRLLKPKIAAGEPRSVT